MILHKKPDVCNLQETHRKDNEVLDRVWTYFVSLLGGEFSTVQKQNGDENGSWSNGGVITLVRKGTQVREIDLENMFECLLRFL